MIVAILHPLHEHLPTFILLEASSEPVEGRLIIYAAIAYAVAGLLCYRLSASLKKHAIQNFSEREHLNDSQAAARHEIAHGFHTLAVIATSTAGMLVFVPEYAGWILVGFLMTLAYPLILLRRADRRPVRYRA